MSEVDKDLTAFPSVARRAFSRWENEGGADLSSRRASESAAFDPFAQIKTRSGVILHVRPITSQDTAAMADLMEAISEDDIRFRFPTDGQRTLHRMSQVDHERTENFVAIDATSTIVATAMLASSASGKEAEVAIAVRAEYRRRGVGWTLLDYVVGYAGVHGLTSVVSTEKRDDHTVIDLETEMGFIVSPYPGDASRVLLTKHFAEAEPSSI